jgi:hypothetical protein
MASLRLTSSLGCQRPVLLEADSGSWYRAHSESLRGLPSGVLTDWLLEGRSGGPAELSCDIT